MADIEKTEAIVKQIADALNETEENPLESIRRMVNELGAEAVLPFVDKAQEIENAGGMMTNNGEKRRTLGGVFFYLVRGAIPANVWEKIQVPSADSVKRRPKKPRPVIIPYVWDQRIEDIKAIKPTERGNASVEIKLIGSPAKILDKGALMMVVITGKTASAMPKGLPTLPEDYKPTYLAMIAKKQWAKVADQIEKGDRLLLTGFPVFDEKLKLITVLVKSTAAIPPKPPKENKKPVENTESTAPAE